MKKCRQVLLLVAATVVQLHAGRIKEGRKSGLRKQDVELVANVTDAAPSVSRSQAGCPLAYLKRASLSVKPFCDMRKKDTLSDKQARDAAASESFERAVRSAVAEYDSVDNKDGVDFRAFSRLVREREMGIHTEHALWERFNALDTNKSGTIEINEWIIYSIRDALERSAANLDLIFSSWDVNRNGCISRGELYEAMRHYGFVADSALLDAVFGEFDVLKQGEFALVHMQHALKEKIKKRTRVMQLRTDVGPQPNGPLGDTLDTEYLNSGLARNAVARLKEQVSLILRREEGRAMQLFRSWDASQEGLISPDEFYQVISLLGYTGPRKHADAVFASIDIDGGGFIDYHELSRLIEPHKERSAFSSYATGAGHATTKRPASSSAASSPRSTPRRIVTPDARASRSPTHQSAGDGGARPSIQVAQPQHSTLTAANSPANGAGIPLNSRTYPRQRTLFSPLSVYLLSSSPGSPRPSSVSRRSSPRSPHAASHTWAASASADAPAHSPQPVPLGPLSLYGYGSPPAHHGPSHGLFHSTPTSPHAPPSPHHPQGFVRGFAPLSPPSPRAPRSPRSPRSPRASPSPVAPVRRPPATPTRGDVYGCMHPSTAQDLDRFGQRPGSAMPTFSSEHHAQEMQELQVSQMRRPVSALANGQRRRLAEESDFWQDFMKHMPRTPPSPHSPRPFGSEAVEDDEFVRPCSVKDVWRKQGMLLLEAA